MKIKRRRDRKVIGLADGKDVSPEYVRKVYQQQKLLLANTTKAEKAFTAGVGNYLYRLNAKFRPQQVFFLTDQVSFIADYYFHELDFIVEVDGSSHYGSRNKQYDRWRDETMLKCGIKTLRFTNKRVITDSRGVFGQICNEILATGRVRSKPYKLFHRCYQKHRDGWLVELLGESDRTNAASSR